MPRIDPIAASLFLHYLDGDESIAPILADRLEETGNPHAAALRNRKTSFSLNDITFTHTLAGVMDVIVYSLPDEVCWRLMCDFAEHVLPYWVQVSGGNKAAENAIAARRGWLEGTVSLEEVNAARDAAWNASSSVPGLNLDSNYQARNAALHAARAAARGGEPRFALRASARDAQQAALSLMPLESRESIERRQVRNAARRRRSMVNFESPEYRGQTELKWQLDRIREYLQREVHNASPTRPVR